MKRLFQNLILVLVLTIAILCSYAYLEEKVDSLSVRSFYEFFLSSDLGQEWKKWTGEKGGSEKEQSRAVWFSYLEFNDYRKNAEKNDEASFRKFYGHVLNRCKQLHIDRILVQVRPFGDALYQSKYFPWAACISGKQGTSPGYDPLAIMTEMTHQAGMEIEAWVNPYRVSYSTDRTVLSDDNPAKKWMKQASTKRNVLVYDGAMYYNPASDEVRELIENGIREIVENYDVDGIHMDDYFYPLFTKDNVETAFDAQEYQKAKSSGAVKQSMSIADWRRQNVNVLVSGIYQTVKECDPKVRFGISPAGNPANLRSDLEYYADIDTWVKDGGYVDYMMPQIYWGYTNDQAPFDEILEQWKELCKGSKVDLYVGLQLYRMGTDDKTQSDYEELQQASLIQKQVEQIEKDKQVKGYCFFSYQYLDVDHEEYVFDSSEFSEKRKTILKQIGEKLKNP